MLDARKALELPIEGEARSSSSYCRKYIRDIFQICVGRYGGCASSDSVLFSCKELMQCANYLYLCASDMYEDLRSFLAKQFEVQLHVILIG